MPEELTLATNASIEAVLNQVRPDCFGERGFGGEGATCHIGVPRPVNGNANAISSEDPPM